MPVASRPRCAGTVGQPPLRNQAPLREGGAAGEQAGGQAHVEGAVHVGAAQRAQEADLGVGGVDGGSGGDGAVGRLGHAGPAEHHGDGALGQQCPGGGDGGGLDPAHLLRGGADEQSPHKPPLPRPGGAAGWVVASSEAEERCDASSTTVAPSRTTAWRRRRKRTGSSSLRSGASRSTVPPGAHTWSMVARGRPEHDLGRKPVAELGVDVVGADDALGQLGPGVGGLVGEPGPAEHRHLVGAGRLERRRRLRQGDTPRAPGPGRRPRARGRPRRSALLFTEPRSRSGPCRTASPS